MFEQNIRHSAFAACWVLVFLIVNKELIVSSEAVEGPPQEAPSPEASQPLSPAEMEILRQHAIVNAWWLIGLGKEELRLLGLLTGSHIGGDLLKDSPNLDFIQPDFGSPTNPYQGEYPGAPPPNGAASSDTNPQNSAPELTPGDGSPRPPFQPPTFAPPILPPLTEYDENSKPDTFGNTLNFSCDGNCSSNFSPSITDPSDEDLVFAPLQTSGETYSEPSNVPSGELPATKNDETEDQSANTNMETATAHIPTVDPLIYPVQFYSQSALSEINNENQNNPGENFNPLAQLAEQFPDNFMGW